MIDPPLEQFAVKRIFSIVIGDIDLSITNLSLFIIIVTLLIMGGLFVCLKKSDKKSLAPGFGFAALEIGYEAFYKIVEERLGLHAKQFFPFVFVLFLFIFGSNMIGLIPGCYTVTSHILVTFAMAFMVFCASIGIGFFYHGWSFFGTFMPKGIPVYVAPLIVPVEILSFLFRPVSLSIRLFANMVAGHVMIKLFGSFTSVLLQKTSLMVFGVIPFMLNIVLFGFEVFVAFLQAYIFCILTCIYWHDAIEMH